MTSEPDDNTLENPGALGRHAANETRQISETGAVTAVTYIGSRTPMTEADWQALGWSAAEANFYAAYGQLAPRVLKITSTGVAPLPDVKRHSPDGFEWGYSGSGPADLALSILCDFLALEGEGRFAERLVTRTGRWQLYREPPYQQFKFAHITPLPQNGVWAIQAANVAAFLKREHYELTDMLLHSDDEAGVQ